MLALQEAFMVGELEGDNLPSAALRGGEANLFESFNQALASRRRHRRRKRKTPSLFLLSLARGCSLGLDHPPFYSLPIILEGDAVRYAMSVEHLPPALRLYSGSPALAGGGAHIVDHDSRLIPEACHIESWLMLEIDGGALAVAAFACTLSALPPLQIAAAVQRTWGRH